MTITSNNSARRVVVAVIAAAAACAGATPAVAAESAAKPVYPLANNTIVLQKSIGGLTIGSSPTGVRKRFGQKRCATYQCTYTGPGYNVQAGFAPTAQSKRAVLSDVTITATKSGSAATRVRTSNGVGVGSPYLTAKKGLPHARYSGTSRSGYFTIGTGKLGAITTYVLINDGVVDQITIEDADRPG